MSFQDMVNLFRRETADLHAYYDRLDAAEFYCEPTAFAYTEWDEEPTQEIRTPVRSVYLIGSLRNPNIPAVAAVLRGAGFDVFDDWFAAGPGADDAWRDYEKQRGRTYREALNGHAAQHVFRFDKEHLDRCDAALLVLPAGKSGFAELAYTAGRGKPAYVLIDDGCEPERWDVMAAFATDVFASVDEAIEGMGCE